MLCSVISFFLKCEIEGRALPDLRLGPDPSAVTIDNSLYDRQPDAGPFIFLGPVQSLEDAEQFMNILHVKTGAVILDEIDRPVQFPASVLKADLDRRDRAVARELEGIGQ